MTAQSDAERLAAIRATLIFSDANVRFLVRLLDVRDARIAELERKIEAANRVVLESVYGPLKS